MPMRILAIEPYHGLSHRAFLEGYQRYSRHAIEIWSLPAKKWKWRMRGSAMHFAERAMAGDARPPDLVLASDYLNVCDWRAIAPAAFGAAPCALYFHENQASYPLHDRAPIDHQYAWINLSSALAAEGVWFNSRHQRDAFLTEARRALARAPAPVPWRLFESLEARAEVFPVGIDFAPHDAHVPSDWPQRPMSTPPGSIPTAAGGPGESSESPILVWNHRWEYDKRPDVLERALLGLARRGIPFRAIVCGASHRAPDGTFSALRDALGQRLLHVGFFADREAYLDALAKSHVVVSTAEHEFFGISVVEAMYLGCLPVLPRKLSYPEIIPEKLHDLVFYDGPDELESFLARFLASPPLEIREPLRRVAASYDWRQLAPVLDEKLERLAGSRRR